MVDGFNGNQHQHYRAQLQAIQVDMTLVLRADPYEGAPLEDGGDEIDEMVRNMAGSVEGLEEEAKRDYAALAGKRYRDFVRQVNEQMEQRDADLTALHVSTPSSPLTPARTDVLLQHHYKTSLSELQRNTDYKLQLAKNEHAALENTVRQRLIASITKKRQQLLRDKEQLDIADSNALLLHPNQFSINVNPGSPGKGERKTRHLRHRAASPSEVAGVGKKRKITTLEPEDGNESPAPAFKPIANDLGGGRSPFKDAREKTLYTQYEAPAYSLERIFTDKELAMATNTAQIATFKHLQGLDQPANSASNGGPSTAVPSVDGEILPPAPSADGDLDVIMQHDGTSNTPPPGAAPEMERTTSHQVLTRGGARANPLAALTDLATLAANSAPTDVRPFAPVMPNMHAVTKSEKAGAPPPAGVDSYNIESDFELMARAMENHEEDDDTSSGKPLREQLLEQALDFQSVSQPYRLPLLETGPARIGRGVDRLPATGFAPVQTVLETRARLQNKDVGGGALAAALRAGGEPMSRTTSAGGSEVGEATRRVRSRLI